MCSTRPINLLRAREKQYISLHSGNLCVIGHESFGLQQRRQLRRGACRWRGGVEERREERKDWRPFIDGFFQQVDGEMQHLSLTFFETSWHVLTQKENQWTDELAFRQLPAAPAALQN